MYSQDDDKLTKCGLDFKKHDQYGIDTKEFGELLISSGLVLNEEVSW
jgi:CCR4-NOT transcription complex subunit 7/8